MTDQNKSGNRDLELSDDNNLVTILKDENEAMVAEINYLREIVKMKTEGIIRYDLGLYISEWNPYMEELTGLRKEEVIGKCITELSIFDNQDIVYELDEILKGSEGFKSEHGINVKNRKTFLVSNTSNPLFNKNGNIDGIVSSIRDITKQKELHHNLEINQIEIEMQNEQLKILNDFLQTSQSKYFELYDPAPIGYCTIDENGGFYNFNLKISSMVGVTKEDIKRRNFNSFIFQEDVNKYILFIRDIFKTNTQKSCEVRMLKADGNVFWCNISANIIQDENNQKKCNLSIIDITLQKYAEEQRIKNNNLTHKKALLDKDELLNQFLRKSPIYAYIKDITNEGSIVLNASDNYKNIIGIEPKDMIGKIMEKLFPEDLARKMTADDLSVVQKGEVLSINEELNNHHYHTIKFPITLSNRTLLAGYTIDITEQKELEDELKKLNRIVKMISECNQIVTQVHNEQELLDSICKIITGLGGYRMAWVGYKKDDEEKSVETAAYCGFEKGFLDSLKVTWDENKDSGIGAVGTAIREDRLVFNDNTLTDPIYTTWRERAKSLGYSSSVAIPISINNSIMGIISVYSTEDEVFKEEEVKLLKDLAHSLSRGIQFFREKEEKDRLDKKINLIGEEIQKRDKMNIIGALAGGIAHDFNNVLFILKGNLELLKLIGPLNEKQNENYNNMQKAINRLTEMIKKIQYLSTNTIIEKKSFDIHKVASEVFNMLKDSIDKIIKLEIGFNAGDFFINGSESSIHQVLLNLSINSNKAFKKRGHKSGDFIRISVDENRNGLMDIENFIDGDYLHISFKDNGPGMSEEVIKKAFDPYFTTGEKSGQGGVGLGLTSVYNIITSQHGGYIYINSKEGKGTTVHIYLPKGKPEKTIDLKKDKLIGGNETILIVDDEKQIQDISKTMLEMFGYKVLVAGDGEEALEIYTKKQNSIDLVIMDITMPIMGGIEALKLMKKTNDSVKVIIATGQSLYDIKDGDLKDAKNVISKPLAMDKYIKTVRGVLDDK